MNRYHDTERGYTIVVSTLLAAIALEELSLARSLADEYRLASDRVDSESIDAEQAIASLDESLVSIANEDDATTLDDARRDARLLVSTLDAIAEAKTTREYARRDLETALGNAKRLARAIEVDATTLDALDEAFPATEAVDALEVALVSIV